MVVYTLHKHSTWTRGGYPCQLALVVLVLVALALILHVQIATCTVHGGGVMEAVPWDSSIWWLCIQ